MSKILTAPHPTLSQKSQPISKVDKKILNIIGKMEETLTSQKNPKGVGLAAPQIGYSVRIFIAKPTLKSDISVFINPEITIKSEELTPEVPHRPNPFEGCLSLPGIWGKVSRHKSLTLRYQTPDAKNHQRRFTGFLAVIIQHEMDHLDGHLFPQRVLEQKGKLYRLVGKDKEGKDIFEDIKLS